MDPFQKFSNINNPSAITIDLEEEKRITREAEGLVELHDFIKSHPDAPVKDIAKFMPTVDSRAVNKAIQIIALRDKGDKSGSNKK